MFVARDKEGNPVTKNNTLHLFLITPTRCEEGYWHTDDWEYPESQDMYLPENWVKNFEHLTWEDDPIEVELIPKEKVIELEKCEQTVKVLQKLYRVSDKTLDLHTLKSGYPSKLVDEHFNELV